MVDKNQYVDFSNTEIAFAHKSDRELKKANWLFSMMGHTWLMKLVTPIAVWASKYPIPLIKVLIKRTIFEQFVGGETLASSQRAIDRLRDHRILTVLDYGAEGKSTESELDAARDQFLKSITFAASNESVPVVSVKISALSKNSLLEAKQENRGLDDEQTHLFKQVVSRLDTICSHAYQLGVKVFIDAEESWMQYTIDALVDMMMEKYNMSKVIVYQTFQMYRKDRLNFLYQAYDRAKKRGYHLGAKIVRGAYMEKERNRAQELGYPSPIHETKADTDADFNKAIIFCVDHYQEIASCAATHNMQSCLLQAELIGRRELPRNHPHLNFCQLYGMSDHITFNLAASGYNVAKYVVYGRVKELIPYLSRRAAENSAVRGEFSREYRLVKKEIERRGL